MKADELWEKYAAHRGNGYPTMDKPDFLAALAEYGEHVKSEAVKVCRFHSKHGLPALWNSAADMCAADIQKMELP